MPVGLSPLETASGLVVGEDSGAGMLPAADPGLSPLGALERVLAEALERAPCLVSFSGGRDSSAMLALALRVAQREGLELPVPITVRFTDDPESEESDWQELVIRELGIVDWHRVDAGGELGVLGPVARASLERHGVLWPPNLHVLAPLLEAARGGSLVTGIGGDELFGLPSRRSALAPRSVRRARARRRGLVDSPWLRPPARSSLNAALAAEHAEEPARWRHRVEWLWRRRQVAVLRASGRTLASAAGADLVEPLLDPRVLASVAAHGTRRSYATRDAAMETLFAGVLPPAVLSRSAKARFTRALWGDAARTFADDWTGDAPFRELVDPAKLRGTWLRDTPDFAAQPPFRLPGLPSRAVLLPRLAFGKEVPAGGIMSERPKLSRAVDAPVEDEATPENGYEPPKLTKLGSFYELTQQQLKVSGSADFVNFQPSHG